jgi:hypothetical protein
MTQHKQPFPFHATDAGRSQSSRPRTKNDCYVRSTALVCSMAYDTAYEIVTYCGFDKFEHWITSLAAVQRLGVLFKCHPFPQPRYDVARFCAEHPEGRWIVLTYGGLHVFAVIDGVVLDERRPRARQCVYAAWKCKRAGAREYAALRALALLMRQMKAKDDDDDYAGFDYEERLARW